MSDNTQTIFIRKFKDINLSDTFFDSLKKDYPDFAGWFNKKSEQMESAYVQYDDEDNLLAFLYLKDESNEELNDINPPRPKRKRLKVGTFKINEHKSRLGERFVKKILDKGVVEGYEEIYLTVYPKHSGMIALLNRYGFEEQANKGDEIVLFKDLRILTGDQLKDYPLISIKDNRKFLLSIYPTYHTKLFPDSILRNEEKDRYDLIKDISPTNSIHKIYLCFMPGTAILKKGDLIAIYRTNDYKGPAWYRSVVTSICQVEEVKFKNDFSSVDDFIKYTNYYSIFNNDELRSWYANQKQLIVIKMTYNIALTKRVTRGFLIDEAGISSGEYFGFLRLTDDQFNSILTKGEINENIIID